jgi:exodeoxyribonuclease VII large subunit
LVIGSKQELAEKLASLRRRMAQAANYKLLRAHNALSRLAQHAVFARMQDSIARRQQRVDDLVSRMAQSQSQRLKTLSRRLEDVEAHLRRHDPRVRLGAMRRQLDGQMAALHSSVMRRLVGRRNELDGLTVALGRASETILLRRRAHWERLHGSLEALSPKAILARGYALVFDDEGRLVKQAAQLKPGSRVRAQLGRGEFTAEVDQVKDEPANNLDNE